MLTNRETVNFQKLNFLRLTINCVTTGAQELNGINQIHLEREMRES